MSKTPNYDSAVKKILDQLVPGERVCALTGEKWVMTDEEIGWYKKFNVPPSKYSPLNRMRIMHGYFIMYNIFYNKHADILCAFLAFLKLEVRRIQNGISWYEQKGSIVRRSTAGYLVNA